MVCVVGKDRQKDAHRDPETQLLQPRCQMQEWHTLEMPQRDPRRSPTTLSENCWQTPATPEVYEQNW